MKHFFISLAALTVLIAAPVFAEEDAAPREQHHESHSRDLYKDVFENDRIRVFETTFNPGDHWAIREPEHEYFVYVLEGDEFKLLHPDETNNVRTAQAGSALWFPALKNMKTGRWKDEHFEKAVNESGSVVKVLVVELKQASSPAP